MIQENGSRIGDFKRNLVIDADSFLVQHFGKETELKPEGQPYFDAFIQAIKDGRSVSMADYIGMLNGFERRVNPDGLEKVEEAAKQGKGLLVAIDHLGIGPLRGYGLMFDAHHRIKQATGQDLRWVQGSGSSFMDIGHDALGKATHSIYVDNRTTDRYGNVFESNFKFRGITIPAHWITPGSQYVKPSNEGAEELIDEIRDKGYIAYCPEGTQEPTIQRGKLEAAIPALMAIRYKMPIVIAAA